jgi:hypothetical protein
MNILAFHRMKHQNRIIINGINSPSNSGLGSLLAGYFLSYKSDMLIVAEKVAAQGIGGTRQTRGVCAAPTGAGRYRRTRGAP